MKPMITRLHGHDMGEFSQLVNNAWSGDETLTLDSESKGGWNSISLLARSSTRDYLLKIPGFKGPFRQHPYSREYIVMGFLYRKGLCPRPMETGWIGEEERIPFIILEFAEGIVPSSLSQISKAQFSMLERALSTLSQIRPPGIPSFGSASDYLGYTSRLVHRTIRNPALLSQGLTGVLNSFDKAVEALSDSIDLSCAWSGKTMHGDLQESNLVFQSDRVLLLDLGSCCVGEPLFDLSYLFSQSADSNRHTLPKDFIKSSTRLGDIEALRPLGLVSAIGWSIAFLANLEKGRIEANLAERDTGLRVLAYVEDKVDWLNSLLGKGFPR